VPQPGGVQKDSQTDAIGEGLARRRVFSHCPAPSEGELQGKGAGGLATAAQQQAEIDDEGEESGADVGAVPPETIGHGGAIRASRGPLHALPIANSNSGGRRLAVCWSASLRLLGCLSTADF
jgi:hypothetical protein